MSIGRTFVRAAVSAVASLALVTGTGAALTAHAAEPSIAAQTCAAEQSALGEAKSKLKKAKKQKKAATKQLKKAKKTTTKADDKKAKRKLAKATKKVKKLKKKVKAKRAAYENCLDNAAKDKAARDAALTAAMDALAKRIAEFTAMQSSEDVDALPTEVSGPMESAFGEMLAHLEALKTQLPASDLAGLQDALALFTALDPAQLQAAIADLAAEIQGADDPSDLQALLDGLIGGLPGADAGGMEEVQAAFEALVAQLQAFDPNAAEQQLPGIAVKVVEALEALQNHSTGLQNLITALTTLNGGSMPGDPDDIADLLEVLTSLNSGVLPTDPTTLTNLVSGLLGGSIGTDGLPGDLGDVIDGVIGGTPLPGIDDLTDPLDPILDPLDPVLDPLDPILEPLPCVPLPLIPCP